jgi:aspartate/methionine/tyrosine aminotransferase
MILSERSKYSVNPIEETNNAARELEQQGKRITRLNIGDPTRYFPTPKYIIEAYVDALRNGKTSYTTAGGLPELREAVAGEYRGQADVGADDVLITSGVSEALMFLNSIMINDGDSALIMRPYYSMYNSFLNIMGGESVYADLDEKTGWGLDTDALSRMLAMERKHIKYMMLANPNNPTGTVLGRKELAEIADLANEHGIVLISDEIYDRITFNGAKFTSIAEMAKGMPHIILNGASKVLDATGFRIGYVIIPEKDAGSESLKRKLAEYTTLRLSANTPAEHAVLEGLRNKAERKKSVEHMVREIADRCNYATDLVNGSEYMEAVRPKGAFYIFPRVRMDALRIRDDKELVDRLLKEELVLLSRGSGFGAESHVRIVGLPTKDVLELAITKLDAFLSRNRR